MITNEEANAWFKDISPDEKEKLVVFALRTLGESSATQSSLRKRFPDVSFAIDELQSECWKPVVSYPGYEVSCIGRVKKSATSNQPEKLLKQSILTLGHRQVSPALSNRHHAEYVHRLVALAFLNPPKKEEQVVDHKDDNPANNRANNLRWVDNNSNLSKDGKDRRRILSTKANRESRPTSYGKFIQNYLDSQNNDGV